MNILHYGRLIFKFLLTLKVSEYSNDNELFKLSKWLMELLSEINDKLERRTGLPVYFWDERLTTVAADKAMMEAGIRRENRKDYVDMIAATLILQGYLDRRNNEKKKETE